MAREVGSIIVEGIEFRPSGVVMGGQVTRPAAYTQTFATADRTHDTDGSAAAAAATATNPAAVTEYTAHAAGATAVTSNAGTDLDTTAAALNTLVDECQVLETELSAVIVDVADIRTNFNLLRTTVADLKQLVNSVIDDLQTLGLLR